MDFNTYQNETRKNANYPDIGNNFVFPTLGLAGEAGEVADKIKNLIRDKGVNRPSEMSNDDKLELQKELGDVLWYLTQIATELGLDLSTVAEANLEKVQSRMKRDQLHGSGDNR
jgi:NTP pyrophosphatase (non-canonical NTP hydrolase)